MNSIDHVPDDDHRASMLAAQKKKKKKKKKGIVYMHLKKKKEYFISQQPFLRLSRTNCMSSSYDIQMRCINCGRLTGR
jgi:hypothetical protein